MNDHDEVGELPELTDDGIRLLYRICELATHSEHPPFRALFAAYDHALEEQHIEQEHDAVIFRYLMRVGESTRHGKPGETNINLVRRLRDILAVQGITLQDDDDDDTGIDENALVKNVLIENPKGPRRRLSFDDARVDERWLSEHSESLIAPPRSPQDQSRYHKGRTDARDRSRRRAQSANSQYDDLQGKRKHSVPGPQSTAQAWDGRTEGNINATLLFDLSQTQLEQNADAFLHTSDLRCARRALHRWQDKVAQLGQEQDDRLSVAYAHDRRTLLRQAWEQWLTSLEEKRHETRRRTRLERHERRAVHERNTMLTDKAFTHWIQRARNEQTSNRENLHYMLMVRYFGRWKAIATETQPKVRLILSRRFFSVWREKTARSLLRDEQAVVHYEEQLMRKYKTAWFWQFCGSRIVPWHDTRVAARGIHHLRSKLAFWQQQKAQAEEFRNLKITTRALRTMRGETLSRQSNLRTSEQHRKRVLVTTAFTTLERHTRLAPSGKSLSGRIDHRVLSTAMGTWRMNASLSTQATTVCRHRLLQNAWTNWNDQLRCRALSQQLDERVLLETLYKWVLAERLRLFQRTMNARLVARTFSTWKARTGDVIDRLQWAERVFEEGQLRRRLSFGMLRLNIAMRTREDAERAAIELANSRNLPRYLGTWTAKTDHARQLAKWAADARFYFLSSSTLKTWKEKTTERRHNRKREGYAQVRARLKTRLAGQCLRQWHQRMTEVCALATEAETKLRSRVQDRAAQVISNLRQREAELAGLRAQATIADQHKLISSALSALIIRQADLIGLDQQALDFRRETELAIVGSSLKKMQWVQFTAARRVESADALWMRNRDTHFRNMLRHWAARAAARRRQDREDHDNIETELDSPSLRPASRANSRSVEKMLATSPPAVAVSATPAYLRTPSRSHRRATRFRPLAPPATFTPMAFDPAYLITTPAPITSYSGVAPDSTSDPLEGLASQITPFARKLRAGGFTPARPPASAFRSSVLARGGGTNKSVRFVQASRFGRLSSSGGNSAGEDVPM